MGHIDTATPPRQINCGPQTHSKAHQRAESRRTAYLATLQRGDGSGLEPNLMQLTPAMSRFAETAAAERTNDVRFTRTGLSPKLPKECRNPLEHVDLISN